MSLLLLYHERKARHPIDRASRHQAIRHRCSRQAMVESPPDQFEDRRSFPHLICSVARFVRRPARSARENNRCWRFFSFVEIHNLFNTLFSFGEFAANVGTWSHTGGWVKGRDLFLVPLGPDRRRVTWMGGNPRTYQSRLISPIASFSPPHSHPLPRNHSAPIRWGESVIGVCMSSGQLAGRD